MTTTVETINHVAAGHKRPQALALVAYDDHATAAARHAKRTTKKIKISANDARAMAPFIAPPYIDAVPLRAVAPSRPDPSWMRTGLLRELGFRSDMELHFIGEKAVTNTDLDTQQSRFRIPNDGVLHTLRGMLSDAELVAANLHDKAPRPRPSSKQPPPPIQGQGELSQGGKRTRMKGKDHVGLPMVLLDATGRRKDMKLTQWDSSRSTVIHGDGYLNFMRQGDFKHDEIVEIWAFREKHFRIFGVDVCVDGPLHVVIAKKGQQLAA